MWNYWLSTKKNCRSKKGVGINVGLRFFMLHVFMLGKKNTKNYFFHWNWLDPPPPPGLSEHCPLRGNFYWRLPLPCRIVLFTVRRTLRMRSFLKLETKSINNIHGSLSYHYPKFLILWTKFLVICLNYALNLRFDSKIKIKILVSLYE